MAGQQYAHEDYTIGWVCALPKTELVAAAALLDEEHPVLPAADPHDANSYLLGRIGDHNVVIACLPAGTTGKVSAATVATDLIRSFPSIRLGLMVGVGGGVPYHGSQRQAMSAKIDEDDSDDSEDGMDEIADIRLGDVVVSLHTKTTEAVVQYDFGKSLQAKGFVRAGGQLNKPPNIVLNAIARLQANHARGHHKIPELLSRMLAANPAMDNFQYPGCEKDRLFRADFAHLEGKKSCKTCCGRENANLVMRSNRTDTAPKIHYGTIGSADQVMKDAILRDQWALKESILCFEMEAAGLIDSFPCLVIRGICDYADSHKNKVWQPYAAATAAAYAKELLLVIPGQGVAKLSSIKQLLRLSEQMEKVNVGLEKAFEQREIHHHDQVMRSLTKDQRRCHQAFKTSTYEKFKNINPNRVKGTCDWVLKSPEYLRWWNATNSDLLWISADPGCGKSVLAKSLIDELFMASDSNISIVYFFFKDNDEQNNLATALCAVLHQLFSLQPQLLRHALPFWERNKEKIQYEVDDMWRIFMAATSDPVLRNIICVFDALDECRDQDQKLLTEKLRGFHDRRLASQGNWLKFLVTSRPYDDIQDRFQPVTDCFPHIHLRGEEENDRIHREISLVVKTWMAELRDKLKLDVELHDRLEKELLNMKHRTYLWLHLAMADIELTIRDSFWSDQESFPMIPKNVDEAYQRILDKVSPAQEEAARRILQMIVGARRPLTIQEMAMALGVAAGRAGTAEKAMIRHEGLGDKIRRLCGLFVFISDSKIYLIHQTAREFFITRISERNSLKWYFKPTDVEALMAQICVQYLLMDDLVCPEREDIHSLLIYSAENWSSHFRETHTPSPQLMACVYKLYDVTSVLFTLWSPLFWKATMPYRSKKPELGAIHLAAYNGHHQILERLIIDNRVLVDQRDRAGTTALQWASLLGYYKSVKLLLAVGADLNASGEEYGNALQAASRKGHLQVVDLLLQSGGDVHAFTGTYGNALELASRRGHLAVVKRLIEGGADVSARGGKYGNALELASQQGHLEIVKFLIGRGVDVNAQGGTYGNALELASQRRHHKVVQILIDRGADVNSQSGKALRMASARGDSEIVRILLHGGADTTALSSALQAAVQEGWVEIVQILLDRGADVISQSGKALRIASARGDSEIVRILLDRGADVSAQGENNHNPLQIAVQEGYLEIAQILLDRGADVNAQGGYYGNALVAAAQGEHLDIFQLLIEKGADIHAHGGRYSNALQGTAEDEEGYHGILDTLQNRNYLTFRNSSTLLLKEIILSNLDAKTRPIMDASL